MPYLNIQCQPVFLTKARWQYLREQALREWTPVQRVGSAIAGTKESAQADELIFQFLETEFRRDPVSFHQKWVQFRLNGDEASENVWDLLYDYCAYYGHARVADLRDDSERILDDFTSESLQYPQGRVFALEVTVNVFRPWWRRFVGRRAACSILIDSRHVRRLSGELAGFTMWTPDFTLICAEDIQLRANLSSCAATTAAVSDAEPR